MKKKEQPGPGRPLLTPGEPLRRREIRISERLLAVAEEIGGGNVSEGIRRALEQYEQPASDSRARRQ